MEKNETNNNHIENQQLEKDGVDEIKSYEYYEKELERVMTELEDGNLDTLDKLIENFEYGTKMIEKCEQILKKAELRIHKISKKD
ncbi:MAG: exodeoxyribonuclease VII small subunit [Candidatus Cloacimonetes bacterium]|nr:exodeoxyribonuclease VII small subunit [Candidatus Cloacimonadota bacterium]